MTVMLLQRSATPQLTPIQKTASNSKSSGEPPFLILLDIQEHAELERAASGQQQQGGQGGQQQGGQQPGGQQPGGQQPGGQQQQQQQGGGLEKQPGPGRGERPRVALIGRSSTCCSGAGLGLQPAGRAGPSAAQGGLAMRYYRLWIYACNLVLLGSALGFAAAVSRTLLFSGDPRRYLVPGVPRAYDPTALYAYLAMAVQLGLVQLLGCLAARRLSARLLHAYWLLLLALLAGDAVIGVAWVFRFERMRADLRPNLRHRLQADYGRDARFTERWDQLQRDFACCGLTGPQDFGPGRWPTSCCEEAAEEGNATTEEAAGSGNATACAEPRPRGCEEQLMLWLRATADLLFVLGFCVITFTKLCFLGILRYEIREMIQKIRLLREPPPPTVPFVQSFCPGQPPQQLPPPHLQQQQLLEMPLNNGNAGRRTTLPIVAGHAASGTTSLFVPSEDCTNSKHPLLASNAPDGGADSDTNSHCALILEESTPPAQHHQTALSKSNGNNNLEMREFNRRMLFSNGSAALQTGQQQQVGGAQQQQQQQQQTNPHQQQQQQGQQPRRT